MKFLRDLVGDGACDRPGEERHRCRAHGVEHELHQQRRHRAAFGEVQPVDEAPVRFAVRRRAQAALAVGGKQVLDDGTRLGDCDVALADHRRLAERVHALERGRGEHRLRIARIALDPVVDFQFLEQPQDALRTGVLEVVHGDHRWSPNRLLKYSAWAAAGSLRDAGQGASRSEGQCLRKGCNAARRPQRPAPCGFASKGACSGVAALGSRATSPTFALRLRAGPFARKRGRRGVFQQPANR